MGMGESKEWPCPFFGAAVQRSCEFDVRIHEIYTERGGAKHQAIMWDEYKASIKSVLHTGTEGPGNLHQRTCSS
jgi:hypothetical protein